MLGPPVCENCELLADYHPNKEYPNKQGDWLCPKCGFECNSHLLVYPANEQEVIFLSTILHKENQGQIVS